jgi:hypothetical protein
MESSLHRLISSLLLSYTRQFRSLDSIQFLCSQAHNPAGWSPETRLNSIPLLPSSYPGRLESRNSTQFNSSAPKLISRQAWVPKLDSIQFLCSQAHIPAGWSPETRLSISRLLLFCTDEHFLITTLHGPRKIERTPLLLERDVYSVTA